MFAQMFSLFTAQATSGRIPWWVWVILIVILLVLLWFWFGREEKETEAETLGSRMSEIPSSDAGDIDQVVTAEPVETSPFKPDDLKKIEGIGPKVASLLNEAGIFTFQQVADTGAEKLESLLNQAGLHMIDADTWPEQAKLAAAGEWEALKQLQDELKGGKHNG